MKPMIFIDWIYRKKSRGKETQLKKTNNTQEMLLLTNILHKFPFFRASLSACIVYDNNQYIENNN